jgi:hypothetical protein
MKKVILTLVLGMMGMGIFSLSAQLSDEEYAYITMDLQGILNLTMTSGPQVDFSFNSIAEYKQGIVKYNATQLEVDATVAWDMYVYAATDTWTQVEAYSTNGAAHLPAEILEISSSYNNSAITGGVGLDNNLVSLKGLTNSGMDDGTPDINTQFLMGGDNTLAGSDENGAPGTADGNPTSNKFRISYRLKPGVPATFPNSTVALDAVTLGNTVDYAQAGYYYLEVVYSLVEDL